MLAANDWNLAASADGDVDRLMTWLPDATSTRRWGGPHFRYPFNRHSFAEDMQWGRVQSFSLRDGCDELAAFGQLYERLGCIHLARLIVRPALRGQGVGKRLITMLMSAGTRLFAGQKYSLFVYRDNTPAYECYRAMGFETADYPEGVPLADDCDYLVRPVSTPEDKQPLGSTAH